jgi:hypothetical protein
MPLAERWTRIISELLLANITGTGIIKILKCKNDRYENSFGSFWVPTFLHHKFLEIIAVFLHFSEL